MSTKITEKEFFVNYRLDIQKEYNLTPVETLVLAYVQANYGGAKYGCKQSSKTIAKFLNISSVIVRQALTVLGKKDLIYRDDNDSIHTNNVLKNRVKGESYIRMDYDILIDDERFSTFSEKLVYAYFASKSRKYSIFAENDTICSTLNLSLRTFHPIVKKFIEQGYISREISVDEKSGTTIRTFHFVQEKNTAAQTIELNEKIDDIVMTNYLNSDFAYDSNTEDEADNDFNKLQKEMNAKYNNYINNKDNDDYDEDLDELDDNRPHVPQDDKSLNNLPNIIINEESKTISGIVYIRNNKIDYELSINDELLNDVKKVNDVSTKHITNTTMLFNYIAKTLQDYNILAIICPMLNIMDSRDIFNKSYFKINNKEN